MAEEGVRNRQYEYRGMSSLVLQADRGKSRTREGTGEVETLAGKLEDGRHGRMGDRARPDPDGQGKRPKELEDRLDRLRQRQRDGSEPGAKRARKEKQRSVDVFTAGAGADVLAETSGVDATSAYRPKTPATRTAYERLLSLVRDCIGDQPTEFLRGSADEILTVLKDEEVREPEKAKRVQSLVGKISSEQFSEFTATGRLINDFQNPTDEADTEDVDAEIDEEVGVAVVIGENEEEEDASDLDEVRGSDDEDDWEEEADADMAPRPGMVGMSLAGDAEPEADDEERDGISIPVGSIDAYWLQRSVREHCDVDDAEEARSLSERLLEVLNHDDDRVVENQVVGLLGMHNFNFAKRLLHNRRRIVFVTRIRRAETEEEKERIEKEMEADPTGEGRKILDKLNRSVSADKWASDRTGKLQSRMRREAASLGRQASGGDGSGEFGSDAMVDSSKHLLDLKSLEWSDGSHLMTNQKCELPEGAWRKVKKGFEEVYVPPMKANSGGAGDRRIPIKELPGWAQPAFKGMSDLNRLQSQLSDTALNSSENMLVCAPTGAGKTNVAMLTMLHEIGQHLDEEGKPDLSAFKIVYVAPMKALVQEVVLNFGKRLQPYGMKVRELSGDVNLTKAEIADTQLIVTTPEKWDIITRKASGRSFTQLVRLLIIDEIHLLHDDRGAVLEAIVARTIRKIETTQEHTRIVGLSATLPNYEDVATFLRVKPDKGLFYFDSSFRPCPLYQYYVGVTEKNAARRMQLMNEVCFDKVSSYAEKNQVIVFVHSRKETARTARALRDMAVDADKAGLFVEEGGANAEILRSVEDDIDDADLKELIPHGFAIHHAGMTRADRTLVEELFGDHRVKVLVSTATLAWGVNLPAHAVVIKGTQVYMPELGRWSELSSLDVMQMLGRAGRPQYDQFGEGVIITSHQELQYYLSLLNQQLPIESQLVKRLADTLNGEIVLGTVQNTEEAATWLGYTYLYVRMFRNPELYRVPPSSAARDPTLKQHRLDLVHAAALLLEEHNLIRYDKRSGAFQSTPLGQVASHYYVAHSTIATFNEHLKPAMSDIELFRLFSLSSEFNNVVVREDEKLEVDKLRDSVPIPVKEAMDEPSAKVNVLLQAYISRLKLNGYVMLADMVYVTQSAGRLVRALFEVCLRRGWAGMARKTLALSQMIGCRQWLSQSPLRQFRMLKEGDLVKLERKDIPWERYSDMRATDLGELVRKPRMGKILYELVHHFPKLELQAHVQPITRSVLKLDLTLMADFKWKNSIHGSSQLFWVIVEDVDGEEILHCEQFSLRARYATEEHQLSFTVPVFEPLPPHYFVRVLADRWLHSETALPVSFRHLILPDKNPPPTELLDMQRLPTSAIGEAKLQKLYPEDTFNAVQTQVFSTLFESDDNTLVAAPAGTGKTVCAEFALLRLFKQDSGATAVYVAPHAAVAQARFDDWSRKFGSLGLGKLVVQLSGETAADMKLLRSANIVIATPHQWDMLSRRWRIRKAVQAVSLFIVDDMHLIGGDDGPTIEVITSRMRYMAFQLKREIRIVALSASLVNGRDLAGWLGCTRSSFFNFAAHVRAVKLDLRVQGFDVARAGPRLLAMSRPVYSAAAESAKMRKPTLIFVPSRRQAQLSAIDLVAFAAADGIPTLFAESADSKVLALQSEAVRENALKQTLLAGVGYIHQAMHATDRLIVEKLYHDGHLLGLVVQKSLCWGLQLTAHCVVVMDAQSFDGREHRYVDYPITDILKMVGYAARPGVDDSARSVVMCHTSRKQYLRKFIETPLPVESHLDHVLHDHLNAEVVTKTIENKQDAVDYLTWTFYYRRLVRNPNYYNLQGTSNRHVSDHLSELVETTLADLEESQCLTIKDEMDLQTLNLGMIAAYYYVKYTSIELFASCIRPKTKIKGLLEILSNASEYDALSLRHGEEERMRSMAMKLPVAMPKDVRYNDVHVKANVLLQSHFTRKSLGPDLRGDLGVVLGSALPLLQALVDVISSQGWLKPALAAMEMSQMCVQGLWADRDSVLLQVPHFTRELAARCEKHGSDGGAAGGDGSDSEGVETIYDLMDMDDGERDKLLGLSASQMTDVARFCNRYPSIDLAYAVQDAKSLTTNDTVTVNVTLTRDADTDGMDEGAGIGAVYAPRFPKSKSEGWWLLLGDLSTNKLLALRRVALAGSATVPLSFPAPDEAGEYNYQLSFMCDSYLGCDQEYELEINIQEGEDESDDSSSDGSEESG